MVTSLLLIRHGQSTWNAEQRWQGQADPPLSDLGREQALAAVASLAQVVDTIDAVVTSPQQRASETAEILVGAFTNAPPIEAIERIGDLRERSAGPWSGLTKDDIESRYPGYLESGRRPDGYESDDSLHDRVVRVLLDLGRRHHGASVLVVCHGGVINTVAERIGNAAGRTSNLSGYGVQVAEGQLHLGDRLNLLGEGQRTGGDVNRI